MTSSQSFRNTMAAVAGAVHVVTGTGPAGRAGCTVSAVCSATDDPPTLLVCISRAARSNAVFRDSGALCVNVLGAAQQEVARRFADSSADAEERFAMAHWDTLATGSPVLRHALAAFDCEITGAMELGTHTVFTCEVRAVRTEGNGNALVYFGRAYHRLGAAAAVTVTA